MICLNMIVKNEAKNMPRCLQSVKDVVDYYVIDDTGSSDNTAELIKEIMDGYGIKGEIFHTPWQNFGYNREQALRHVDGKADYCLILDADSALHYEDKAIFDNLTADAYMIEWRAGSMVYRLPTLFNIKRCEWHWRGAVHNYLAGNGKSENLDGVRVEYIPGGGAKSHGLSSKDKFLRDAKLLEEELKEKPNDPRTTFYLAQSYRDAKNFQLAYKYYNKRIALGGWVEEVYEAMYQAAKCKNEAEAVFALDDFLAAYNYRPSRAEPLHEIARHYRQTKMYSLAYSFAKTGVTIPCPSDILFVQRDVYEWRLLDELAIAAYWTGRYKESEELCDKLLSDSKLPEREIERVKQNRDYARRELAKQ